MADAEVLIVCRAKVSDGCLDGQPSRKQFGPDFMGDGTLDPPLAEDGTYDGESIVCDPCYMVVCRFSPSGAGLHAEIPAAIAAARKARERRAAEAE